MDGAITRIKSGGSRHPIADLGLGEYVLGIVGVVRQLASEVSDKCADELRLAGILGSPYPLQYLVVGEHSTRVVCQLV